MEPDTDVLEDSSDDSLNDELFRQHLVKVMVPRNVLYWLILWGKTSGRKKNQFASQIVISRVKDHVPAIKFEIEKWAEQDNIPVKDLIRKILESEKFPFINESNQEVILEENDEID